MTSAYLEYLRHELSRCQALQGDVAGVIGTLTGALNTYEDMSSSVKDIYIIDGEETTTYNRVIKNKEEVEKIKNHLAGPTSGKISARIGWLQAEIAKELARLAELARQAAEAAASSGASSSTGGDL